MNHEINWQTVNAASIELIETSSGQRIPVQYVQGDDAQSIKVSPDQPMEVGNKYWLVVHPTLQDVDGVSLKNGSLAIVEVKNP